MKSTRTTAHSDDSIRAFRAGATEGRNWRPPIPGKERLLVALTTLILLFTAWALGGMRLWTQYVLGGASLAAFLVSLVPQTGHGTDVGRDGLTPWRRLLRFPIFWLGGLFVLYGICQQLNAAWVYEREGTRWWLEPTAHLAWLPSGIEAPMHSMSGWRCLIWMGGAWLLVCALWCGLQHRRSAFFLLWTWVLNTTVLAFVGVVYKLLGAREMLGWIPRGRANSFFGTFYYANHAGAYLLAGLGITLGLSLHSWVQAQKRGAKSNPGFFLLLLGIVQFTGIFFTASRGSILLAVAMTGIYGLMGLYALKVYGSLGRMGLWTLGISLPILLAGAALLFSQVNFQSIHRDLQKGITEVLNLMDPEPDEDRPRLESMRARKLFAQATLDMWEERPLLGHGLGGYRHYIVLHQKNYEPIYVHPWTYHPRRNPEGRTLTWRLNYAHSDWLQFLAELGILGSAILVAVLVGWAGLFFRRLDAFSPATWVWLGTVDLLVIYGAIEFIFWSPSVFYAFCLILPLSIKTLRP